MANGKKTQEKKEPLVRLAQRQGMSTQKKWVIRIASIVPEERIPFEKASEEIRRKLDMKAKNEMRAKYADNLKSKALIRYYF